MRQNVMGIKRRCEKCMKARIPAKYSVKGARCERMRACRVCPWCQGGLPSTAGSEMIGYSQRLAGVSELNKTCVSFACEEATVVMEAGDSKRNRKI